MQTHANESLGARAWRHARFFAITRAPHTRFVIRAILTKHDIVFGQWNNRPQYLHFLKTNAVCFKCSRDFHRGQREQLREMVLHHVAQRAIVFVVGSAVFHAQRFGYRDLHALDVIAIPRRFKQRITKTKGKQVLHHFFAEVVINAIHLLLIKVTVYQGIKVNSRRQIATKRFFD